MLLLAVMQGAASSMTAFYVYLMNKKKTNANKIV